MPTIPRLPDDRCGYAYGNSTYRCDKPHAHSGLHNCDGGAHTATTDR